MESEISGGPNPRYKAGIPSFLAMLLPTANIFVFRVLPVCILVLTVSRGKPITVPITPAESPPVEEKKKKNNQSDPFDGNY